jgi:hypothetical protein
VQITAESSFLVAVSAKGATYRLGSSIDTVGINLDTVSGVRPSSEDVRDMHARKEDFFLVVFQTSTACRNLGKVFR